MADKTRPQDQPQGDPAAAKGKTTPRADHERRADAPPPAFVNNQLRHDRWRREQELLDEKDDRAWEDHPPGGKLFVTAISSIPTRRRGGLDFPNVARREVEIIDGTDAEVRALQATGASVVNPIGAKEIHDDTGPAGGLIVFSAPGAGSSDALAGTSDEQLEAELAARRARVNERREKRGDAGAPQRLGKGRPVMPGEDPPKG